MPENPDHPDDEVLTGGGVNVVVRRGDRVCRPTGPWSPLVHELLDRLHRGGFKAAPRFHDVTPDGLEILDFLPGEVSNYPVTGPVEVVCHGDFAPHDCVLHGDHVVAMIDFDTARPGPRLLDVAAGAYRWVPLSAPDHDGVRGSVADHARRLRTFCDAYGLDGPGRRGLVDAVVASLESLVAWMRAEAAAGSAAFTRHLAEGHHVLYLADPRPLAPPVITQGPPARSRRTGYSAPVRLSA